jgi:hypothetical protein
MKLLLKLAILLSAVTALIALIAIGTRALRSQVDLPDPWAEFAKRCAAFEGARIAFDYDDDRLDASRAFYLNALADGRVGIDEFDGYNMRYAWAPGEPFTEHWRGQPTARIVPGVARYLADVWAECRAGFSGSVWHHEFPSTDMDGYSALWNWRRLELPFEWAQEVPVWVAAKPTTGAVERIVFEINPEPLVVSVLKVDWDADVASGQVSPLSPSEPLEIPPFFDNGVDFADLASAGTAYHDNSGPTWSPTKVTPNCLTQPNGRLVRLEIGKEIKPGAWDSNGAAVRIANVVSNEPDSGTRPGDLPKDVRFNGKMTCVRAEKTSSSAARLYTITLEAKDAFGNVSSTTVSVMIPGGQSNCQSTPYPTVPDTDPSCQL